MDKIQRKVGSIMDGAESSLSDLIQAALRQKKYDDVALVAEVLNQVAKVRQGLQLPGLLRNPTAQESSRPEFESDVETVETTSSSPGRPKLRMHESGSPRQEAHARSSKYPLFFRDDSRLIKIGWSKKNKDEYIHRVPKDAVFAFAEHLDRSIDAGAHV